MADRDPSVLGGAGRRIPGVRVITAEETSSRPPVRGKIDALLGEIRRTPPVDGASESVKKVLENVKKTLADLERLAKRGLKAAESASNGRSAGKDIAPELEEMEEIDGLLLSGGGRNLVSFLIQPIILELAGRSESGDPLEDSRRLYGEIAESAAFHLGILSPLRRP
jgi:hypothetical protein